MKILTDEMLGKPNHDFTNFESYLGTMFASGKRNIDFDVTLKNGMNLQREFVWTLHQKQQFILSMLKGIHIPNFVFYVYETLKGDVTYKVIDGKQRISTIISFMNGEFPLYVKGEIYYFNDLHQYLKSRVGTKPLHSIVFYGYEGYNELSDEELINIFDYVNFSGTPQDEKHIELLKISMTLKTTNDEDSEPLRKI